MWLMLCTTISRNTNMIKWYTYDEGVQTYENKNIVHKSKWKRHSSCTFGYIWQLCHYIHDCEGTSSSSAPVVSDHENSLGFIFAISGISAGAPIQQRWVLVVVLTALKHLPWQQGWLGRWKWMKTVKLWTRNPKQKTSIYFCYFGMQAEISTQPNCLARDRWRLMGKYVF